LIYLGFAAIGAAVCEPAWNIDQVPGVTDIEN